MFVDPPTGEETVDILIQIKDSYDEHHDVVYDTKQLEGWEKLSER